jgi:hypothetical protein
MSRAARIENLLARALQISLGDGQVERSRARAIRLSAWRLATLDVLV